VKYVAPENQAPSQSKPSPEEPDVPEVPDEPELPEVPEVPVPIPETVIVPPVLFCNSKVPVKSSKVAPVIAGKDPGNILHLALS
jgi:hypothetical protein